MIRGNQPTDGGHLLLTGAEVNALDLSAAQHARFIRRIYGAAEFIKGLCRYCLWIKDQDLEEAQAIPSIAARIDAIRHMRLASCAKSTNDMAIRAHQMLSMNSGRAHTIVIAVISSENRPYLPCGLLNSTEIITNKLFGLYDAPLWNMALVASRLHLVWIAAVCGRMKTDYSYSNTMGWNTFPVPLLTEKNKADLTRGAEDILLAREAHFPATIADLYHPETMPGNLRRAHEKNDETLERIFIGRRFRNDTERLEILFKMYSKMKRGAV
ncbi:MAG: lactate dehydrogenase, partial [Alphaproteobacteria bacterium]|nr:lactate dehydrogenase [Alphaproteobacteria bacterium]